MSTQLHTGAAARVTLRAGSYALAALAAGPESGRPVLLLPGYTGSKEDFGPVLDPLAARGLRVLALDLPGQFESPPLDGAGYSPDVLGGVVIAAARSLGTPVRLLGHSFGGLVARAAVIADPAAFSSLVLLSSGPAQIGGARRSRIERLRPILQTDGLPGVLAAMRADPAFVPGPPDLEDFLQRRFLAGAPAMLQGMGDALRSEPDRVAELAATGVPTLVVHGAGDDAWPPEVQREMAHRLGARYVVIADAAHSAAVENPGALAAALLDFWHD